ncbi:hypothetical protein ACP4OV_002613 [Aristida adscensionis]
MASTLAFSRCSLLLLLLLLATAPSRALKIGDLLGKPPLGGQDQECSRTCEADFCVVPPLLRYGKYCGIMYSGCLGEKPCDDLDACCMVHDHCVDAHHNDYLNTECNENLLRCLDGVNPEGPTFRGNQCGVRETSLVIRGVIEAAVLAGKILDEHDGGQ